MAVGKVWLAWVDKGYAVDRRGKRRRGDVLDAGLVRRCLGISAAVSVSLRSLLVLAVVVALPCSWLAVEMKKATKQQEAVEALIRLNCGFEYDYEVQFDPASFGLQIEEEWYPGKPDAMPSGPAWLRKCLGIFNSLYEVNCNRTPVADADLAHFEGLTSVVELRMTDTGTTDLGLERLKGLINR